MTYIDTHGGPERFALETDDGVRIPFDEIESSGWGYWILTSGGDEVARVHDIDDWPGEAVRVFRDIQFGRDVNLGAQTTEAV